MPGNASLAMHEPLSTRDAPPTRSVWGFWPTTLLAAGIGLVCVVAEGAAAALAFKLARPGFSWGDVAAVWRAIPYDGRALSVAMIVTALTGCALVFGAIRLRRGLDVRAYLGLRRVPTRTYLTWIAAFVAFLVASDVLSIAVGKPVVPEVARAMMAAADPLWLFLVATVVAAPVFEEALFRGFVLRGFAASPIGHKGAIVATSTLWSVSHTQYDAYYMACIFVAGLILGAARIRTGSLLVPVVLHALANLGAFAQMQLFYR